MSLSRSRLVSLLSACVSLLCLFPGVARGSMLSIDDVASPFPGGGVYVPVIGQLRDPNNPLFFYDFLFGPPAKTDVETGVVQYDFIGGLSMTSDPLDASFLAIGTMTTLDITGGQFTTCWAVGCSPSMAVFPDPQFGVTPDLATVVLRADPNGGPERWSTGLMTVTGGPGAYQIDSFFDIFFELCLTGCDGPPEEATWEDLDGSVHYELFALDDIPASPVPEPGTLALFGAGLLVVARSYRVRMARRIPLKTHAQT